MCGPEQPTEPCNLHSTLGLFGCCVCPAGACEASLACSTCHVVVEVGVEGCRIRGWVSKSGSISPCVGCSRFSGAMQQQQLRKCCVTPACHDSP